MLFPKKYLLEVVGELDIVEEKIVGKSRWSVRKSRVFRHEGKLYRTEFSEGATEYQDVRPYEYEPDMIECPEVFPVEKTIIVYE
jgi:hypothetical protein